MIPKPAFQDHSALTFLPKPYLLVSELLISVSTKQLHLAPSLTTLTNRSLNVKSMFLAGRAYKKDLTISSYFS